MQGGRIDRPGRAIPCGRPGKSLSLNPLIRMSDYGMLPLGSLPSSPRRGAETVVDSEIEGIEQPGTDF